jgi:hypothetical protein
MTALEKAVAWQNENSSHPFLQRLIWNMQHGFVHCDNETFIMGHPLKYDPKTKTITMNKTPNAWFVELAAATTHTNSVKTLWRFLAARPLKYVIWLRRGFQLPHIYLWDKLDQKLRTTESAKLVFAEGRVA